MATLTKDYQFLGRSSEMKSQDGKSKYYILLYGKTEANEITGFHKVTIKEVLASLSTSNASFYYYTTSHSGTIAGKTAFSGNDKPNAPWNTSTITANGVSYKPSFVIGEGSVEVDATDGTEKNVTLSCNWKFNHKGATYTPANGTSRTVSVNATLPAIPRPSKINAGSGNIGSALKIGISRVNSSFTDTLEYEFGNLTGTIVTNTNATTVNWNIPESFYGEIKNSNTGTGKIICKTYNGEVLIGTSEVEFTANVVNSDPVINAFTYKDSNDFTFAITEDRQRIIRDNSNLLFTIGSASPQNSATITKYEITFNDRTLERTSAGTLDFGRINLSSNSKAVLKVTDSRGNTSTKEITVIIDDWKLPTGLITCNRRNNFYSETLLKVDSTYSSINGKNSVAIQYQYRKLTDKNFSELFNLQDNVQASVELDNNYQWHIIVIVGDRIGETKYNLYIDRGIPLAFFDKLRSSMGINCFPQNDGSFEIDGNTYAKGVNAENMVLNGENLAQRIKGYGEVATQIDGDYDTMCGNRTGIYRTTSVTNAPFTQNGQNSSSNWFFLIHIAHSEKYQMQIASPYFKEGLYYRNMMGGTWGEWIEVIDKSHIYSTTETKVGIWRDGKPIYRKVLEVSLPAGSTNGIDTGISNFGEWVKFEGIYTFDASGDVYYGNFYQSSTSYIRNFVSSKDNKIRARVGTTCSATFILEYTKTTD
jgi:hypothetical protein